MKKILLNTGETALVDNQDFKYLSQFRWTRKTDGKNIYAIRYQKISSRNYKRYSMHREILNLTNPKILVDHKDHNGLNNQRKNLRQCNAAQNCWNSVSAKGKSKFKGVTQYPSGSYRVRIGVNGVRMHLGVFKNELDAHNAYKEAAKKFHKEYACYE